MSEEYSRGFAGRDLHEIPLGDIERAAARDDDRRTPYPGGAGYLLRPHTPHAIWNPDEDHRIAIYENFSVWSMHPPDGIDDPLTGDADDPFDNEYEQWFLHGFAPGRLLCNLSMSDAEGLARSLLGLIEGVVEATLEMLAMDEDDE